MASFAVHLKDMFFVLVERITGYGGGHHAAGAQEPTKVASAETISQAEQVTVVKHTEIRARSGGADPPVLQGSKPQVNVVGSI